MDKSNNLEILKESKISGLKRNKEENNFYFTDNEDDNVDETEGGDGFSVPIDVSLEINDKTTEDIIAMIVRKDIDLQPDYQRKYVWTRKAASKLIESLIIGIPIPPIYLAENKEGFFEVVDGQQRLTAVNLFYNNNFHLSGLTLLKNFNGKKFSDLKNNIDMKYFNSLRRATIRFIIIKKQTDPRIKFNLFERINTGASKLNAQEVRNAVYHGQLIKLIKDMSSNKNFVDITNSQSNFTKRSKHLEFISRFLTMYSIIKINIDTYKGNLKNEITEFYEENRYDNIRYSEYKEVFLKAMKRMIAISPSDIIILDNNRISSVLFELLSVGFAIMPDSKFENLDINKFKDKLILAFNNDENIELFKKGTNNTSSVKGRYKLFGEIVDENQK